MKRGVRFIILPLLVIGFALVGGRHSYGQPESSVSYQDALSAAELIASHHSDWSVYRTEGASMGEFFGNNSLILVQQATIRELRVGMLVLYRSPKGEYIAHRVIENRGAWLETRGISNSRPDPVFVKADMVVGIVFCVLHSSGFPEGALYTSDGKPLPTAVCKKY